MSDIWSGIGVDIASGEGTEWLYQVKGETRGPVPQRVIVERLLAGDIGLETPVAKEGGDFHPISRVAAFASHLKEAKKREAQRINRRRRRIAMMILLPVLAAGGVGGFFVKQHIEQARIERELKLKAAEEELAQKRAELAKQPKMGLVALVTLGPKEDIKIRSEAKKPARRKPSRPGKAAEPEPDEMVQSCQLSQQQIFATLGKHLAKINVCVQDEKSRDTQNLMPSTLSLDFVVKPSGKVVEFEVGHRHYRRGPLNNCMTKAFSTIRFPESGGSNCPVTLPIKIGS